MIPVRFEHSHNMRLNDLPCDTVSGGAKSMSRMDEPDSNPRTRLVRCPQTNISPVLVEALSVVMDGSELAPEGLPSDFRSTYASINLSVVEWAK